MNTIKYLAYASLLMVRYNAFGMMSDVTKHQSKTECIHNQRFLLGLLYTKEENQTEYFQLLDSAHTHSERFQWLERMAKIAQHNSTLQDKTIPQIDKVIHSIPTDGKYLKQKHQGSNRELEIRLSQTINKQHQ